MTAPFKQWLDQCISHLILVNAFMSANPLFALSYPLFGKSQEYRKKKLYQFRFILFKSFVSVIHRHLRL